MSPFERGRHGLPLSLTWFSRVTIKKTNETCLSSLVSGISYSFHASFHWFPLWSANLIKGRAISSPNQLHEPYGDEERRGTNWFKKKREERTKRGKLPLSSLSTSSFSSKNYIPFFAESLVCFGGLSYCFFFDLCKQCY